MTQLGPLPGPGHCWANHLDISDSMIFDKLNCSVVITVVSLGRAMTVIIKMITTLLLILNIAL